MKIAYINLLNSLFVLLLINHIHAQEVKYRKTNIDKTYVSSAITTADIDQDGLEDIVAGDVWYKAPNWKRYEIRTLGTYYGTLVDSTKPGARYYARSIGNYTKDVDGDGWLDIITFNSQGAPCYWYRNPQGNYDQLWSEHLAIEIFHNESPQMIDLFGDGDPVVLAGHLIEKGKYSLSWFSPGPDPTQLWEPHVIGHPDHFNYSVTYRETESFAPGGRGHGLGVGDINGDGINDIITAQGWYQGPVNGKQKNNWKFNPIPFDSMADPEKIHLLFAQMFADDFDGDGDNDLIAGSAHAYGLWWFEQKEVDGKINFIKHVISMDFSQLHAMNAVDLDGDGKKEFITGKRYLAHLGRDPGSSDPAAILYVSCDKDDLGQVRMTCHLIDDDSGSGTQIWISDINQDGKPDILTSNKKGTNLFTQE